MERLEQAIVRIKMSIAAWGQLTQAFKRLGEALRNFHTSLMWAAAQILKKKHPTTFEIEFLYMMLENDNCQRILLEDETFGVMKEADLFLRGELYGPGFPSHN